MTAASLPGRLIRWADARDRRLAQGGHAGATGTQLLREAAAEIDRLVELVELASTPGRWDDFLTKIGDDNGR